MAMPESPKDESWSIGALGPTFSRGPDEEILGPLVEVNERCIELLVHAARASDEHSRQHLAPIRELLLNLAPAAQRLAAHHRLLLVDIEFTNIEWWYAVKRQPYRSFRLEATSGSFPRRSAVQLARATLTLVWHCARRDRYVACVVLGITPAVADIIATLRLEEIDRIAERQFRRVRPRWEDRPTVWRKLLLASQAADPQPMHHFTLQSLQLMLGELLLHDR
jgi:hypothetical protein